MHQACVLYALWIKWTWNTRILKLVRKICVNDPQFKKLKWKTVFILSILLTIKSTKITKQLEISICYVRLYCVKHRLYCVKHKYLTVSLTPGFMFINNSCIKNDSVYFIDSIIVYRFTILYGHLIRNNFVLK